MAQVRRMTTALGHLVVEGLGSVRHIELNLNIDATVFIGANGSDELNLVSALELVSCIWDDSFQEYLCHRGGVDSPLFENRQTRADHILITLMSGLDERDTRNGYRAALHPDRVTDSGPTELYEWLLSQAGHERHRPYKKNLGLGSRSRARDIIESKGSGELSNFVRYVRPILEGCRVFHFDDVSGHMPVKGQSAVGDDLALRSDAKNITACPHRVSREHLGHCKRIMAVIRRATPFLDDFVLRPDPPERIQLCWKQWGLDYTFLTREASDGTLRFIYLTALLLGPDLLAMVALDEPDLGLHPATTDLLAEMARVVGRNDRRALLAIRSVPLVSHFGLGKIVALDRANGATGASHPDEAFLAAFLGNYSTGNLWEMSLLGGRPMKAGLGTILNRYPTFAAWWQDLLSRS